MNNNTQGRILHYTNSRHLFFSHNSSFTDDRLYVEGDSQSTHMVIENSVRARQESPPAGGHVPGRITYFPAGLAKMPEEPAVFNFRLFLFDNLRLQCGPFPDDGETEVQFAECRKYCEKYVANQEARCKDQVGSPCKTR